MKKVTILFLLTIYLFLTTDLNQLLKLPIFVTHYIEHKEQNHKLTLLQFVINHYTKADVKHADNEKDIKLPFKTSHNFSNQINLYITPSLYLCYRLTYQVSSQTEKIPSDESLISSYLSSIWQPPKNI